MTKFTDFDKLQTALASLQPPSNNAQASADEDDSGEGSGGASVIIEKTLFAEVFGLQRAHEKRFGPVGEFDPIAYVAQEQALQAQAQRQGSAAQKSSIKKHPIMGHLSKFDGDDRRMSMDPQTNDLAQQRNEQRNELRLANRPGSAPKLKPGGM